MTDIPTLDAIAQHLRDLVPDASLKELDDYGLLILTTESIFVGFSIADEDIPSSYERSYQSFKNAFSTMAVKGLEPSFVLCADARIADIEKLSSTIETDVYFCRKYVLPFSETVGHMLIQLPFLPLEPIGSSGARPETAQTFLQLNGIPSELARHIVVPSQRSPESIIDLCLQGHYGDLKSDQSPGPRSIHQRETADDVSGKTIKVESVSIEGFRAYREKTTFRLGGRVTFLYGPNGFGKTSFFDAFDFALTGGIGRLGTDSRNVDLQGLATHLDAAPETSRVSMRIWSGDEATVIERDVKDAKNARVSGSRVDRKGLLSRITGATSPSADRVENLVSLFRATHLFSQEQQELTKDMQEKSELSAEIVSRMLALDDYAASDSKLSSILDEIASRRKGAVARSERAANRAQEVERAISGLLERVGVGPQADISPLIASLTQEAAALGVVAPAQDSPIGALRALRAPIEYLLAQLAARDDGFGSLRARVAARALQLEQLASVDAELARQSQASLEAESEREKAEATRIAAEQTVLDCSERESCVSREYRRLEWALKNEALYKKLLERASASGSNLPELAALLQARTQEARDAQSAVTFSASLLQTRQAELSGVEEKLDDAKRLQERVRQYPRLLAERAQGRADALRLQESISSTESALVTVEAELGAAKASAATIRRSLMAQEKKADEVRLLVEGLRQHVHDSECPFCGHDHGTTEALLERLARFDSSDPNAGLRDALREATDYELSKNELQATLRSEVAALKTSAIETDAKVRGAEQQLSELEAIAASKGIVGSGESDFVLLYDSYVEGCAREVASARERLSSLQRSLDEQRLRLTQCQESLLEARAIHDSEDGVLQEVRRDRLLIETDANFVQSELLSAPEELEARISILQHDQVGASDRLLAARDALQVAKTALVAIGAKLNATAEAVGRLSEQSEVISRSVNSINNDIRHAGFTQEDVTAQIDSAIQAISKQRSATQSLLEKIKSAEVAADAATTAVALEAHRATLDEQRMLRDSEARDAEDMASLHSYFRGIRAKVQSQRNASVSSFTTRYGPRTSVIQKRLRAVYGFEEVTIASAESRIHVSVSRQGKKLRPTDYFSQSQQQTLLLGLFLTACSSQTWSEFGPILLDDPVAHFDDLNTYAFLDLVRGLLLDSGRQFVISTCDERFMQMAIRKFRSFGSEARFYRFQSIGANGPEISEIENTLGLQKAT